MGCDGGVSFLFYPCTSFDLGCCCMHTVVYTAMEPFIRSLSIVVTVKVSRHGRRNTPYHLSRSTMVMRIVFLNGIKLALGQKVQRMRYVHQEEGAVVVETDGKMVETRGDELSCHSV